MTWLTIQIWDIVDHKHAFFSLIFRPPFENQTIQKLDYSMIGHVWTICMVFWMVTVIKKLWLVKSLFQSFKNARLFFVQKLFTLLLQLLLKTKNLKENWNTIFWLFCRIEPRAFHSTIQTCSIGQTGNTRAWLFRSRDSGRRNYQCWPFFWWISKGPRKSLHMPNMRH